MYVATIRRAMYSQLLSEFGAQFLHCIESLPREEIVHTFLGRWHPLIDASMGQSGCISNYNSFICIVYRYMYQMYTTYPRS